MSYFNNLYFQYDHIFYDHNFLDSPYDHTFYYNFLDYPMTTLFMITIFYILYRIILKWPHYTFGDNYFLNSPVRIGDTQLKSGSTWESTTFTVRDMGSESGFR